MKILITLLISVVLLTGCGKNNGDLSQAMDLRQRLSGGSCSFQTEITADYGDRIYEFSMRCKADTTGELHFELLKPDTLAGISGMISQSGGKLEFEDRVLLFESLTQGQLTPVIAPWLMYKVITGGYIQSVSEDGDQLVYTIDDTYNSEKLMALLTMQKDSTPVCCEIFWSNRRILTLQIIDFQVL